MGPAYLLTPAQSRPVWLKRRTFSRPVASGPAPGPCEILTPRLDTGRPKEQHKWYKKFWAAGRTENSPPPPLRSSSLRETDRIYPEANKKEVGKAAVCSKARVVLCVMSREGLTLWLAAAKWSSEWSPFVCRRDLCELWGGGQPQIHLLWQGQNTSRAELRTACPATSLLEVYPETLLLGGQIGQLPRAPSRTCAPNGSLKYPCKCFFAKNSHFFLYSLFIRNKHKKSMPLGVFVLKNDFLWSLYNHQCAWRD